MGELRTGDQVFDAYGTPCNVTEKSPVKRIGTYIVRFDDGSSVVCDREHIWWTAAGFGTNVRPPFKPTAKPVSEIISTLRNSNGAQHRVPVAGPLDLPESDLPIDPYLLGCWLGDGAVRGGTIHKGRDLFEILEADGHSLGVEQDDKSDHCVARTVIGLTTQLRAAGLLHNKHIPAYYLRASAGQRVRLLQGLMDTDGTWNTARNSAAFSTTDKALAGQVEELMLSLGQRPHVSYMKRHGYGLTVDSWTVEITPVDLNPFRLPRKADQAAASVKSVTRSRRRVITQVLPGPDVDTACIAVDSPTHTYLCGDRMIPTHNSGRDLSYGWGEISIQMALYAHGAREGLVARWDPDAETADPDDPGAWVWEDIGIPAKSIRQDVGVVMHVPIGEKTCTLHWIDLTEGWKAVQLCDNVRDWRKAKGLQTPFSIAEVPTDEPGSSPRVRASTWAERFASITSRPHATLLYREYLRAGGVHGSPEANRLIAMAIKHLEQLEESTA
jgi:replicative DNA helicase